MKGGKGSEGERPWELSLAGAARGAAAGQGRRARPAPAGEVTRATPWRAAGLVSFPAGLANTRS